MVPGDGWPVARSRRRMKFAESEPRRKWWILVKAFATIDTSKEGYEGRHNLNETQSTKSPAEPELKKPRSFKDDDGQDF